MTGETVGVLRALERARPRGCGEVVCGEGVLPCKQKIEGRWGAARCSVAPMRACMATFLLQGASWRPAAVPRRCGCPPEGHELV